MSEADNCDYPFGIFAAVAISKQIIKDLRKTYDLGNHTGRPTALPLALIAVVGGGEVFMLFSIVRMLTSSLK